MPKELYLFKDSWEYNILVHLQAHTFKLTQNMQIFAHLEHKRYPQIEFQWWFICDCLEYQ